MLAANLTFKFRVIVEFQHIVIKILIDQFGFFSTGELVHGIPSIESRQWKVFHSGTRDRNYNKPERELIGQKIHVNLINK